MLNYAMMFQSLWKHEGSYRSEDDDFEEDEVDVEEGR